MLACQGKPLWGNETARPDAIGAHRPRRLAKWRVIWRIVTPWHFRVFLRLCQHAKETSVDGIPRRATAGRAWPSFAACGRVSVDGCFGMAHLRVPGTWDDAQFTMRRGIWGVQLRGKISAYERR